MNPFCGRLIFEFNHFTHLQVSKIFAGNPNLAMPRILQSLIETIEIKNLRNDILMPKQ